MGETNTESMHELAKGLDLMQPEAILTALLNGQEGAVAAVRTAIPDITTAAVMTAGTIKNGGNLVYAYGATIWMRGARQSG